MNRKRWALSGFLTLCISSSAFAQSRFVLRDVDCKLLSNNDRGEIETNMGDKSIGTCKRKGKTALVCTYTNEKGFSLGGAQEYEIQSEQNGFIAAKSASGNITLMIDSDKGRFYYGMVYLAMEQGQMLTKNCVGTAKSR